MWHRAAFAIAAAVLPVSVASGQGTQGSADIAAGHQLFTQSCGVCHLKPQITSPRFGPLLSHQTVAGKEEAVRVFVQTGTPDMPGFRYELAPEKIDLIIAYLATLPDPAQPDPGVHGQAFGERAGGERAAPGRAAQNQGAM